MGNLLTRQVFSGYAFKLKLSKYKPKRIKNCLNNGINWERKNTLKY